MNNVSIPEKRVSPYGLGEKFLSMVAAEKVSIPEKRGSPYGLDTLYNILTK